MASDIPQLRTAGVIAAELDAPLSRVLYVLRHRNIKPIGRAALAEIDRTASAARQRDTEPATEEPILRELDERPAEVAQAGDAL
jgi:hypothetical protein